MDVRTRLEGLKGRRRNVHPLELHALLTDVGFERRHGKGDHWVYRHRRRRRILTIDPRNPLLPVYVSQAIRAIEEVIEE